MSNYSDNIRQCTDGVIHNPYQGTDKRVLFVCSMGILRSATGSRLYSYKYNTRSAGSYGDALIPVTPTLLQWADKIVFVNKENYKNILMEFDSKVLNHKDVHVLDIPDMYEHMHPKLIEAYEEQFEPIPLNIKQYYMNKVQNAIG